ncbi:MAG: PQQ-dependent sugar dehydrogenase [Rubrivivax sp.]
MRRAVVASLPPLALALAVSAAIAACSDDGGGDESTSPSAEGGADAPVASDASSSPFGFDERPKNTSCHAPARPPARKVTARYERVFTSLSLPANVVDLVKVSARFYVVDREGRILAFDAQPNVAAFSVALDLRAAVNQGFEGGLLSFAPHPKFASNGFAYVYYTRTDGTSFYARLSRVHTADGGATFEPSSEKTILEWPIGATGTDHTGGRLVFGPDGLLYFSTGDAFTPADAQNTADLPCTSHTPCALQGKILRLDVDGGDPYAIPKDNPFASGGGKKELYAWGLRNVFRFSFDRATGDLWAADVGDLKWDEVDKIERGGNYGWPRAEGTACNGASCAGLVDPVFQIPNASTPGCQGDPTECAEALVGGVVYRGAAIPELYGAYLTGDFVLGSQWAIVTDPVTGEVSRVTIPRDEGAPPVNAAGYAEDEAGEVHAIDFNGLVYKLVRGDGEPSSAPPFPAKLSATGCVLAADPTAFSASVIPYDVNVPFFSDGADKLRGFAIPDGATIGVLPDGDLDLPKGSVVLKTFRRAGKPVETRLFVRHEDGGWAGYSYAWDDDGKDATLLSGGATKNDWIFPSRTDCLRCHTNAAGGTLGLELAQLSRTVDYPGRPARDQIATLDHVGLFASALPKVEPLPAPASKTPESARARAILHARCSHCHRPGTAVPTTIDLRFGTPLAATKTCNVAPSRGDLGIPNAKILAPGAPGLSVLVQRMQHTDVWRMPPLGTRRVDEEGVGLVTALAQSTTACP